MVTAVSTMKTNSHISHTHRASTSDSHSEMLKESYFKETLS